MLTRVPDLETYQRVQGHPTLKNLEFSYQNQEWRAGLTMLLDRNRSFAEQFTAGDLKISPRMSTILLTCLGARVDPAHLFGLGLGDALVIRNAGGRITPAVMEDLGILGVLAGAFSQPGISPRQPELVIIHHTDCGMSRLAKPASQGQVAERLGLGVDEVSAMAIRDPTVSVQDDVERLRHTPGTPNQLVVSGFVYDLSNGTINQVVPPAPLRATSYPLALPMNSRRFMSSLHEFQRNGQVGTEDIQHCGKFWRTT